MYAKRIELYSSWDRFDINLFMQIRSRFKRRINAVNPTADEVTGVKRASQVNETISVILPRKLNVQPPNNHESGIGISEIWFVIVVLFLSLDLCIS